MSNTKYEVRSDFLPVRAVLQELSPELGGKVAAALQVLESDPCPRVYEGQRIRGAFFKITVTGTDEDVAILYEVHDSPSPVIDLINIKRAGGIRRKLAWLAGLKDFRP